jgi:hypothetical protein
MAVLPRSGDYFPAISRCGGNMIDFRAIRLVWRIARIAPTLQLA